MFKSLFTKRISEEQQIINILNQYQESVIMRISDVNETAEQLENINIESVEKYLLYFNNHKYYHGAVSYFNFLRDIKNRNKGHKDAYKVWLNDIKANIEKNIIVYEF